MTRTMVDSKPVQSFHSMLLVAVPQLEDSHFFKKVVLILHHDDQGAFGLVLNDPSEATVQDFASEQNLDFAPEVAFQPVYSGGPVDAHRGWVLHNALAIQEKQKLAQGLFVSGTQEALEYFFAGGQGDFRFMLGYAGWGPGQLEKEMQEGSWLTLPVEPKYVFGQSHEAIWLKVFEDLGVDPYQLAQGSGLH